MPKWEGVMKGGQVFAGNLVRHRVQRKMAEGMTHKTWKVAGINDVVKYFTPDGLESFILAGNSIIIQWAKLLPDDLKRQGLKDMENLREHDLLTLVRSINWEQVLDVVAKKYPQQVAALRRHPQWVAQEIARAQALMEQVVTGNFDLTKYA